MYLETKVLVLESVVGRRPFHLKKRKKKENRFKLDLEVETLQNNILCSRSKFGQKKLPRAFFSNNPNKGPFKQYVRNF